LHPECAARPALTGQAVTHRDPHGIAQSLYPQLAATACGLAPQHSPILRKALAPPTVSLPEDELPEYQGGGARRGPAPGRRVAAGVVFLHLNLPGFHPGAPPHSGSLTRRTATCSRREREA
jgi:hypothetical protein